MNERQTELRARLQLGTVVNVTRSDGSTFKGCVCGTEQAEGAPSSLQVRPIPESLIYFLQPPAPFQLYIPEDWKVERAQGVRRVGDPGSELELEQFMAVRAPTRAKLRRLPRQAPLRRLNPSGKATVGARVTVSGLDGEWLVISLAAQLGHVHIQSNTTGELNTVRGRDCTYAGEAIRECGDDQGEQGTLF